VRRLNEKGVPARGTLNEPPACGQFGYSELVRAVAVGIGAIADLVGRILAFRTNFVGSILGVRCMLSVTFSAFASMVSAVFSAFASMLSAVCSCGL
jgi:uncharacterized membrane protein